MTPAMGLLRTFLALTCALALAPAWADTGAVSQLSGTLSVKKPDGTVRLLARNSEVRSGDVLSTRATATAARPSAATRWPPHPA